MSDERTSPVDIFSGRPHVMGILNVTPDSFSDGGKFINKNNAIERGIEMIRQGAKIIDVGGESTRPGSEVIDSHEEIARVVPVIEELKKHTNFISIDTRNAATMEAALKAGANIINDISALSHDSRSAHVAAEANVPVILMHMQGNPQTMQKNPSYNNVIDEIFEFLKLRISFCETHRIDAKKLILDPGIGFGKTLEHNLLILRYIKKFNDLECPVLLGASRKRFIGELTGAELTEDRLPGSLASVLWAASQGVRLFRVHDVKETVQALQVYEAISEAG